MLPTDSGKVNLSVIAPCFNEEGNVETLIDRSIDALEDRGVTFEVVLVDDASQDKTYSLASAKAAKDDRIIVLRHGSNQGMFAAWRTGLDAARGTFSVLIDADLQNPPEAIPQLLGRLRESGADVVQGVRSNIEWEDGLRYRASRGLNWVLNRAFSDSALDNKSGFLLARTEALKQILTFQRGYFFPQTFVRVAARAKGYSMVEHETLFLPRRSGVSFLDSRPELLTYGQVLLDVLRARKEFDTRKPDHLVTPSTQQELESGPTDELNGHEALETDRSEYLERGLGLSFYFLTLPAHGWLLRPGTRHVYDWLQQTQWQSPEALRALQSDRLRRLVTHAYANVPYYRGTMDEFGIQPTDIQSVDDLKDLPFLSKDDVRENLYFKLIAENHSKRDMHRIATSGSTGQPFVTYADREQLEIRFASTIRSLEWTGWRFREPQVRLWHQTIGLSRTQELREKLDARLMNRTFIPAFELSEEGLEKLVRKLNQRRPVLIDGYAESLNYLGLYLQSGKSLDFTPRAVMSSAQMLTRQTRETIEEELGTRVFDKYGAREFSGIAYECGHGGPGNYHVLDESYIVELLVDGRSAKPGETGEVVITDLNNYSVPLIRYRIGDLAVATENTPCPCGRGLSRIGQIQGRTQALVHCANGRWLPGTFFAHFFKEYEELVQSFQVKQAQEGAFTLLIVKGSHWTTAAWSECLRELGEFIGSTRVETEFVDEIPLLATGKRTPVVSEVRVDFQQL